MIGDLANFPDSKAHEANMGPTWELSAPDGPHVGPWTLLAGLGYLSFTVVNTTTFSATWDEGYNVNFRGQGQTPSAGVCLLSVTRVACLHNWWGSGLPSSISPLIFYRKYYVCELVNNWKRLKVNIVAAKAPGHQYPQHWLSMYCSKGDS